VGLNSSVGRLRVALVGEYPISEESIQEGGIQSVTHALAHALARRPDIECHVVAAMNGATIKYRRVGELHVHYIRRLNLPRLVTQRIHDVPALVRLIRSINPDIVHGEGQDRQALAALGAGFPTVITPHGVLFIESRMMRQHSLDITGALRQYLITGMEREVFRRASDMIIISRYLPQIYGALLRARTHFIENPIGQEFFQVRRSPEAGRLLFVGTVVPRKRVQDIVAAVAQVLSMPESSGSSSQWRNGLQLRIAGPLVDTGSEALLRSTIESTGLQQRVILLGPVSQSQLLDEYARAQILVLASKEETAPQVIAQAMACGLPTVASAVGGIPAMVREGETGLMFPFSDTQALAKQLFRLLSDSQLRKAVETRIVLEGRERFHPDSVAAQTVAVYREILARNDNGPT
jgi:glycosyltransferase involved in cell wall biosynthesis